MRQNLRWSVMAVAILWAIFFLGYILSVDLRALGIQPRHLRGMSGILFAPLVHNDFGHLVANSGALVVLLTVLFSYSRGIVIRAMATIVLGGGSLVWIFGSSSAIHLGASGVIFGLIGFFLLFGYFRRGWKDVIISTIILFLYGGVLVISLLDLRGHISWSSHFFGLLSGILAARWLKDY